MPSTTAVVLLRNIGSLFVYVVLNHAPFTVSLVFSVSKRFVATCHSMPSFISLLPFVVVVYMPSWRFSAYGRPMSDGGALRLLPSMALSS